MLTVEVVDLEQVLEDVLQVVQIDEAGAVGHSLINLDEVVDSLDVLVVEKLVDVDVGVVELRLELLVRVGEQVVDVNVLLVGVLLFTHHPTDAFVDKQLLIGLQVFQVVGEVADDLVDEGLSVTVIHLNEHLLGQLGDLEVGLTGHVLHTGMAFVHELVQLVHYCLQEGPVVDKESGELADNVHDVGCDERLRVLCLTLLAQVEELFDHGTQELVLLLDRHAARDGAKGPTEFIENLEVDIVVATGLLHQLKPFVDDLDHLVCVAIRQEDQRLSHHFVKGYVLCVDLVFLLHLAIVVNGEKHFVGLRHQVEHDVLDLGQDLRVDVGVHQGRCLGLLHRQV